MSSTYTEDNDKIPADKMLIVLYVLLLLSEYDKQIDNKEIPASNPYIDRITMPTEGDYIEVPKELQRIAIQKWILSKEEDKNEDSEEHNRQSDRDDSYVVNSEDNIIVHDDTCYCKSCDYKKSSYFASIIQIVVCLLIIIAIFYLLSWMRQGFNRNRYH